MNSPEKEENGFLRTIKSISEGSKSVSTWSLSIIGGSILAILSTSYLHPVEKCLRLLYLLFILGWGLIAVSIYYGINITGRSMAAELYSKDENRLKDIFSKSNSDFASQLKFFKWSLCVFALWLILYLLWWIFGEMPPKSS